MWVHPAGPAVAAGQQQQCGVPQGLRLCPHTPPAPVAGDSSRHQEAPGGSSGDLMSTSTTSMTTTFLTGDPCSCQRGSCGPPRILGIRMQLVLPTLVSSNTDAHVIVGKCTRRANSLAYELTGCCCIIAVMCPPAPSVQSTYTCTTGQQQAGAHTARTQGTAAHMQDAMQGCNCARPHLVER